jgi:hypothetical protein
VAKERHGSEARHAHARERREGKRGGSIHAESSSGGLRLADTLGREEKKGKRARSHYLLLSADDDERGELQRREQERWRSSAAAMAESRRRCCYGAWASEAKRKGANGGGAGLLDRVKASGESGGAHWLASCRQ